MIKIAWHPLYNHPVPENHRFPMEKYDLLPEQLLYEGTITKNDLFTPELLMKQEAELVHSKQYLDKLFNLELTKTEERRSGFTLTTQLINRELTIMGGTLQGALFALKNNSCALNIAGGTHHAGTNNAEGFCLLNDLAISAAFLLKEKLADNILIIDLDVHQGNGTAQIFKRNKNIYTFSMHGELNYPPQKEFSTFDIGLKDHTTDDEYLRILRTSLNTIFTDFKPDFVLYQSGVDVLASDQLGRLSLTVNGCKERDAIVFEYCKRLNIPIAVTMGGGYSKDIKIIIEAHANTFRLAKHWFA
jgi:acetoin utilization deacetylase AcuC-like enzyme